MQQSFCFKKYIFPCFYPCLVVTLTTEGWVTTAGNDWVSMVRSRGSNSLSLASNKANKLHLLFTVYHYQ